MSKFQPASLMRGETRVAALRVRVVQISIHSPHTRGDADFASRPTGDYTISIHSPPTRGDKYHQGKPVHARFQSTPLMRGETSGDGKRTRELHFNPLPSHEGRPQPDAAGLLRYPISIRSPLTRGDPSAAAFARLKDISIRSPLTRGDDDDMHIRHALGISIHSPHTRGDSIILKKSIRIYVSLHNKTMIHRFSELYKPLFAAQSPIFGVRSPRESHDSFTFARFSEGSGITP